VKPLLYQAFEAALDEQWEPAVNDITETMRAEGLRVLGLADMPVGGGMSRPPAAVCDGE